MNRILIALIATVMLVASCNSKSGGESDSAEKETTETKAQIKTINLTKAEFLEKVVNFEENPEEWIYLGDKPAIIDFYADWCPPCKVIAPILEELAAEYEDEIYIYKIDTDVEQELAAAFGIQSIPTLLFIPMDDEPQMTTGALPKENFEEAINEILLKKI